MSYISHSRRRTVVFVQPALAAYRLPFYRELGRVLANRDLALRVLVPDVPGDRRRRNDLVVTDYAQTIDSLRICAWPREMHYKRVPHTGDTVLYVLEHGSTVLENYVILGRSRVPVALWGHGGAFVSRGGAIDGFLERWQLRRAAHYFAYTDEGAAAVLARGLPSSRLTVVRNSTDTSALTTAREAALAEVDQIRRELGLRDRRVALFVGGLDAPKRLEFLVTAAEGVARAIPGFIVLVVGDGRDRRFVEEAEARGAPIRYLGRLEAADVGRVSTMADIIMMPGSVGLIAVDSFALGLPIATTRWPHHGPEFAYLRPGQDSLVTDDVVEEYARGVAGLLADTALLQRLTEGAANRAAEFTVEGMAARFSSGIDSVLLRDSDDGR